MYRRIEEFLATDPRLGSVSVYYSKPTCTDLERYFDRIFQLVSGQSGTEIWDRGLVPARVYYAKITGLSDWLEEGPEKVSGLCIVKNPQDDIAVDAKYGDMNAIVADLKSEYLFAGIVYDKIFVIRPIRKPYQEHFRPLVQQLFVRAAIAHIADLPVQAGLTPQPVQPSMGFRGLI